MSFTLSKILIVKKEKLLRVQGLRAGKGKIFAAKDATNSYLLHKSKVSTDGWKEGTHPY